MSCRNCFRRRTKFRPGPRRPIVILRQVAQEHVRKRPGGLLKKEVPTPDEQLVFPSLQRIQVPVGDSTMPSCLQRKYIDLIYRVSTKWVNWDPPIEIPVCLSSRLSARIRLTLSLIGRSARMARSIRGQAIYLSKATFTIPCSRESSIGKVSSSIWPTSHQSKAQSRAISSFPRAAPDIGR